MKSYFSGSADEIYYGDVQCEYFAFCAWAVDVDLIMLRSEQQNCAGLAEVLVKNDQIGSGRDVIEVRYFQTSLLF